VYFRHCLLITAALACAEWLPASTLLLDTGVSTSHTPRNANSGAGEGVSVSTLTTLNQMAMDISMPSGGDIKYMIWDGSNANLLFSEEQAVAANSTLSYVLSTPFSFTLAPGNTYYFGVIGDGSLNIDLLYPARSIPGTGLATLGTANSNYTGFSNPEFAGGGFFTMTALQLFGSPTSSIPEPATFLPVVLGSGWVIQRKLLTR
jgi:hypothetical protein